ncbi:MAG: hypothetical protein HQL47_04985 [Gammaproteobacteria bacterium]|nr:hypothetical protein [Gammaproteobacteria bacterium]
MNNFFKVVIPVGLILLLLWVLVPAPQVAERMNDMPWQIELFENGSSKALGIHLGQDSLEDVMRLYGPPEGMALFAATADGKDMSLEAYFGTVRNGPLAAKLVLVLEASREEMFAMGERALTRKPGPSGAYQWLLAEPDKALMQSRRIKSLTYIPLYGQLDEEFFKTRFGEPASRARVDEKVERWFYPDKGLSILIDQEGKEVLQYVMPRDFRLMEMNPDRR